MQVWLRSVLNAIVKLEEVPSTLKSGNIIAVYKGSCRNPGSCTYHLKHLSYIMPALATCITLLDQLDCLHYPHTALRCPPTRCTLAQACVSNIAAVCRK